MREGRTYAYEVIAKPIVFRITITVIIASPLNSGYVSMQYVIVLVTVAEVAAERTNAENASPNPTNTLEYILQIIRNAKWLLTVN